MSVIWKAKARFLYDLIFAGMTVFALGLANAEYGDFSYFTLVVAYFLFCWFEFRSITFAFKKNVAVKSIQIDTRSREGELDLNISYISPLGFVITFGVICNQLFLMDNNLFYIEGLGEISEIERYEWVLFAVDNFIRAVCLDFFETFNVHISRISSQNYYVLMFVFIYKTTLGVFFLKSIYNLYNATILVKESNF
ncbi:MAG: hypothetical protein N4A71_02370 [Carboxylicivirga sp.]|jgi:hypothetical protein|nr:hypothetical protein [Carboxylicivirga sp.]